MKMSPVALTLVVAGAVMVIHIGSLQLYGNAAGQADFSNTNGAIQSAFVATYAAEQSGGNVSSLVAKLNIALQLVQKAQAENASSPSQAAADLRNATQIVQQVSAESASVAQTGTSNRQLQRSESIGAMIVIVIVAVLVYIYGGRVYRRAWLFLYGNYVVRPTANE